MTQNDLKDKIQSFVGTRSAGMHMVKEVIKLIVKYTGEVCSDDVRFYVKSFDPSPAVIGTAFRQLVKEGTITKCGTKPTDIKSSKGRDIAVFKSS
jgi:hypothetical protein